MQKATHTPTSTTKFGESLDPSVTILVSFGEETGRTTMQTTIGLSQELQSFLRPGHLKFCDRFHQFRLVSKDRVEASFMSAREDYVRERITQVARTIQFMDVTGLVPSSREIYGFRTCSKSQRLPGQDHATTWRDPVTRALVMMDEPYGYVDQLFMSRNHWAEANGYCLRRLKWGGTYRPEHGTVCDLVTKAGQGAFIDQIIDKLEGLDWVS